LSEKLVEMAGVVKAEVRYTAGSTISNSAPRKPIARVDRGYGVQAAVLTSAQE
jgi:hypothetical protein